MGVAFYFTASGRSPVREFLEALPEQTRLEVFDAISLLEQGKILSMPLSRSLSNVRPGLHELRFRDRAGQLRVVYYVKKRDGIYLVHAFRKKTQEIPKQELDIILKRIREI